MTYTELVNMCSNNKCDECPYKKECETFDISELYNELEELENKIKEIYK